MKILVTLKVHQGHILCLVVMNTSPLGRKWTEWHLDCTLFLSLYFFLYGPRWTIVSRKTSMVPKGASTQPVLSVFILLFSKNVRGFCFAFIFLFQVQGQGPFAFCSWKLKNVTCCKSFSLNRHSWSCVWKCIGRFYETCGDVGYIWDKNLITISQAVQCGVGGRTPLCLFIKW